MSSPCVIMTPPTPAYHSNFDGAVVADPVVAAATGSVSALNVLPSNCLGNNNNHESGGSSYASANEIMRGHVTLLSSSHGPQRVILSVFKTSVDHFALVYPDNR